MKRIYLVFAAGIGLMSCGNNHETGTGGSIDSAYTAPAIDNPTNNTDIKRDTATLDSTHNSGIGDTNMRKSGSDTKSGKQTKKKSGASAGSYNSGAAKDDTSGSR